jgi:uncharacterized membrane protein HdeD (DUF308 family)
MQHMVSNYRTMFLFRGLAAILFGVLTLVWPKLSFEHGLNSLRSEMCLHHC